MFVCRWKLIYRFILHLCQVCQPVETTRINRAHVVLLCCNTWQLISSAVITAALNPSVCQTETQTVTKLLELGCRSHSLAFFLSLSLLYVIYIYVICVIYTYMTVTSQQMWVTAARLRVIHLDTVMREADADLNALDGVLPGQRTWGWLSETCVCDDTLVSLAALGRPHTLPSHGLVAQYPCKIFHFPLKTMEFT